MRHLSIVTAAVGVILSGLTGCGGTVTVTPPVVAVSLDYKADVRPMTLQKQVIHSSNPAFCADVQGDNAANHATVRLSKCHGKENQRWSFGPGVSGAVQVGGIGGLCLNITPVAGASGSHAELLACNGSIGQQFRFYVDGRIQELGSNACLTAGAGNDGAGIVLSKCDITNLGQIWGVAGN